MSPSTISLLAERRGSEDITGMSALMNAVQWLQDIAKTDDDVFVNIGLVVKQVPLLNFTGIFHHELPRPMVCGSMLGW